jgi:pyridoxamine 5'-phosphate oxidase family protein
LTPAQIGYLATQRLGRLATAGPDHKPHVVPTSFFYNHELAPSTSAAITKKYRDVQANPWAAFVIDDLVPANPWTPRMLKIRGQAEAIPADSAHRAPRSEDVRPFPDWASRKGRPSIPQGGLQRAK